MANLFDPPPAFDLPVSLDGGLNVEFLNVVEGSDPTEYTDWDVGTEGKFVIGKLGATVAECALAFAGHVATAEILEDDMNGVKAGLPWRFILTSTTPDTVVCNGKTVRFDGV